jgi:hypothetical protein
VCKQRKLHAALNLQQHWLPGCFNMHKPSARHTNTLIPSPSPAAAAAAAVAAAADLSHAEVPAHEHHQHPIGKMALKGTQLVQPEHQRPVMRLKHLQQTRSSTAE